MPPTDLWPLICSNPRLFGARNKRLVAGFVAQEEGHVHAGTGNCGPRRSCRSRTRQSRRTAAAALATVARFLAAITVSQAALALEPLEHQPRHIDGVGWRRVEHGAVVGHDAW